MRLELNVPALERLIGGDTELELHLRKQVVHEFAKRHLKEVAEQATYQAVLNEVKDHINMVVKEHYGIDAILTTHLWPTIDTRLKLLIESLVDKHVHTAIDNSILKIIEQQKHYWIREINLVIKNEMERQIEKQIEEGIQKRLTAAKNITT